MKRFLLDTGIAQDFINRRNQVTERADQERHLGTALAFAYRSSASFGPASKAASLAIGICSDFVTPCHA